MKERFSTCSKDCYGSCVFRGFWDDKQKIKKFKYAKPLKTHPFTSGFFCAKLNKREDLIYDSQRLTEPLIRSGEKGINSFRKIAYNHALKIIKKKVESAISYNPNSILGAFYSGNSGLISMYGPLRFLYRMKATITKGGICNEGGIAGLSKIFGTYSITNPFQINSPENKLIVNWAANISDNNNHLNFLIKKRIKNGTSLVIIDSRELPISRHADLFLQPYPNSDHLLAKVVLSKLIKSNNIDLKFLKNSTEDYHHLINEFSSVCVDDLLPIIGVNEQKIDKFVRLLTEFQSHTITNIGYGLQKHKFGGKIVQMVALIPIFLGNIGKSGAGILYSQSGFNKTITNPIIDYITKKSKVRGFREIELINLGSELKTGDYKILFIYNMNPASSLPNQKELRKAFKQDDLFVVVLDLFLNETTAYADIVIPSKFDLEASDLVSSYSIPGISIIQGGPCPFMNCKSNYEFFRDLVSNLTPNDTKWYHASHQEIYDNCLGLLTPEIGEKLERDGYYLLHSQKTIPFNDLSFPTSSGKINLSSINFKFEKEVIKYLNEKEENEFFLITPSYKYFLHSQLGELHSSKLGVFNNIYLNSKDIEKINPNIKRNMKVLVQNERYSAYYVLKEDDSLKAGVACIYSGPSSPSSGNNANFFTPTQPETLGFSGTFNSAKIRIRNQSR